MSEPRRYTDVDIVETEEGLALVRPMDVLLAEAIKMSPPERWLPCPKCGIKCPLMFGNSDGSYHCAICQTEQETPQE